MAFRAPARPLLAALLLAAAALAGSVLSAVAWPDRAAAQDLKLPAPGTAVEFDNGSVYRAFATVGDQVFVVETTGDGRTVVHVMRYGRFDSLIFRNPSRSEIYFTKGSVEDLLGATPDKPLEIAYEVYVDNRLTSRVNGVALRGQVTPVEVAGTKLPTRPLSLQLSYYDPDGNFQQSVKLTRYFSEALGLPLRIEYENATSGEKFTITAKKVIEGTH
ncbi:hypothetical protein SAMN06265365_101568 [Tistlia consotensis]|uniref:Outer membrane lipoprotein-sorting protein n=1 Tax=Tistlia consotensis USBA 355 TaxID=560819 RepID=A0A1Y6B5G0_9PROT|nr:hypothetical protein [Tistlia consotensis]SME93248.1 hypothetical protein SAMN05428998_101567 [Tistlia consotensis USBA 355]SNR28516.1 hypothetical protein SAMN06265365_101568 [Tistlia consotensis]